MSDLRVPADTEVRDIWVEGETMRVNMGPQHPSTHGVLRLKVEMAGETLISVEPVLGYLHTGIEKTAEALNWIQATTDVTRADYLSNFFNEAAYSIAVEKLAGVQVPPRAQWIRVLLMELNRISSHLVWLATSGLELGAMSIATYGFREREMLLDIYQAVTGVRMNHAYIRPGGVVMDLPAAAEPMIRDVLRDFPSRFDEYEAILTHNPIWVQRNRGIGILRAEDAIALAVTGPILRASGVPHDLRRSSSHLPYDQFDFEIPVGRDGDCYDRYAVRMAEMRQSLRIVTQALDTLPGGPVMVADPKIAMPAQLALGPDGIGNAQAHIDRIMGQSMEALIHHFKLVTEGFTVPEGTVYSAIESPRGELGYHVTSNGTNQPYRVKVRDPSFLHIGCIGDMTRDLLIADVIAAVASIDPVMGGVDR